MIEKPGPPVDREARARNITLIMIGAFLLLLVVAGVWIMEALRDIGKMQDCAMQGRRNCAPIEIPRSER